MENNKNYFSTGALILGIASLVLLCLGGSTLLVAVLAITSALVAGGAKVSELRSMSFKQAIDYKMGIIKNADSNAKIGALLAVIAVALSVVLTIVGFIATVLYAIANGIMYLF